ncbi:MAG: hypothetical protein FWC79_04975 [Oscillospiraceae bacterium]|nr:hypothetical protein [Oscillospiraceae bacterium]
MERQRTRKVFVIIALLLIVAGVTVAFAALSTTLNIDGTGLIQAESWEVRYENLRSPATVTGEAVVETMPTLTATSVTGFHARLSRPGDSVRIVFDVTNAGTIPAEIGTLTKEGITFTGLATDVTDRAADEALMAANVTYTLTYTDGAAVAVGDTLTAGQTRELWLTLSFNSTASALPTDDVEIGGLGITTIYVQD